MSNEMITYNEDDFIAQLTGPTANALCTVKSDTLEEKEHLFNIIANPSHRVTEMVNMTINVKDIYVEVVELADKVTGEPRKVPRVILIDSNNEAYQCVSSGVFGSLKKLVAMFGSPTWNPPLPVKVIQIERGENRILSLVIDTAKKK